MAPVPDARVQASLVLDTQAGSLTEDRVTQSDVDDDGDEAAYAVEMAWWKRWCRYSGYKLDGPQTDQSPGPLNNEDLLDGDNSWGLSFGRMVVPNTKTRDHDYVVVTPSTWEALVTWHTGGPPVHVRADDVSRKRDDERNNDQLMPVAAEHVAVLPHPVSYTVHCPSMTESVVQIDADMLDYIGALKRKAREALNLDVNDDDMLLWDFFHKELPTGDAAPLKESLRISECHSIFGGQDLLLTPADETVAAVTAADVDWVKYAPGYYNAAAAATDAWREGGGDSRAGFISNYGRQGDDEDGEMRDASRFRRTSSSSRRDMDMSNPLQQPAHRTSSGSGRDKAGGGSGKPRRSSGGSGVDGGDDTQPARTKADGKSSGGAFTGSGRALGSGSGGGAGGMKTRNGFKLGYLEDSSQARNGCQPGLVGLSNLGNTCFMNSSLQCLAHAAPLMACFLTGHYRSDINATNPLGMKGELAEALAHLIDSLWQPNVAFVTPRGFKAKIGHFAPQFSGYQQHDSQEFLAFLLDGLHEDVNRIRTKPYVEEKDIPGRSDDELAAEAWSNYRLRNDSVIVDHFQGLYKSTLDCPQCGNASTKFDPFMYLSLPLPESRVRSMTVCLLTMDGSARPVLYAVDVANSGTVRDLYTALLKVSGLEVAGPVEAHLLAAKVSTSWGGWNQTISTCPDPRARIVEVLDKSARDDDVYVVYYYPDAAFGPQAGLQQVTVLQRRCKRTQYGSTYGSGNMAFYAAPLLLFVQPDEVPPEELITEHKLSYQQKYVVQPIAPLMSRIHGLFSLFRVPPSAATGGEPSAAAHIAAATQPATSDRTMHTTSAVQVDVDDDLYGPGPSSAAPAGGGTAPVAAEGPPSPAFMQPEIGNATAEADTVPLLSVGGSGGRGAAVGMDTDEWVDLTTDSPVAAAATASAVKESSDATRPALRYLHAFPLFNPALAAAAAPAGGTPRGATCCVRPSDPLGPSANKAPDGGSLLPLSCALGGEGGSSSYGQPSRDSRCEVSAPPSPDGSSGPITRQGVAADISAALQMRLGEVQQSREEAGGDGDAGGGWLDGGAASDGGYLRLPVSADDADGMEPGTPDLCEGTGTSFAAAPSRLHPAHGASTADGAAAAAATLSSKHRSPVTSTGSGGPAAGATAAPSSPPPPPGSPQQEGSGGGGGWTAGALVGGHAPAASCAPVAARAAEPVAPFDMWEVQKEQEGKAAATGAGPHEAPAVPGAAFIVYLANEKGTPEFYSGSNLTLGEHRSFVLEWLEAPPPDTEATSRDQQPPAAAAAVTSGAVLLQQQVWTYDVAAVAEPEQHASAVAYAARTQEGPCPVSLSACVEAFLQPEQLSEADSWYCPKCKMHVQADKKLDLWRLPEVLVVHLKRFSYTRYHRDKLETPVDFPLEGLDLSQYVLRPQGTSPIYDCFAVSNHFGSLGGGHYTAFCKTEGNKWHCFDDSHVSPVSDPMTDVRSPAAYVLFYRRRAEAAQQPPDFVAGLLEARTLMQQQQQLLQQQQAAAPPTSPDGQLGEHDQDGGGGDTYRDDYKDAHHAGDNDDLMVTGRSTAVVVAGQLYDTTPPRNRHAGRRRGGAGGAGGGTGGTLARGGDDDDDMEDAGGATSSRGAGAWGGDSVFPMDDVESGGLELIKARDQGDHEVVDDDLCEDIHTPDVDRSDNDSVENADMGSMPSSPSANDHLDRMACSPT